jgi:hypothetical protein
VETSSSLMTAFSLIVQSPLLHGYQFETIRQYYLFGIS